MSDLEWHDAKIIATKFITQALRIYTKALIFYSDTVISSLHFHQISCACFCVNQCMVVHKYSAFASAKISTVRYVAFRRRRQLLLCQ
jgi:hypothetical protein